RRAMTRSSCTWPAISVAARASTKSSPPCARPARASSRHASAPRESLSMIASTANQQVSDVVAPAPSLIGASPPRLDAWEKVRGATVYAGDLTMPGMLHAKILWSKHPHALIRGIDTRAARAMPGVHAVLTADDVAPPNRFGL